MDETTSPQTYSVQGAEPPVAQAQPAVQESTPDLSGLDPETPSSGGGKKKLYIGIGVAVVILIGVFVFGRSYLFKGSSFEKFTSNIQMSDEQKRGLSEIGGGAGSKSTPPISAGAGAQQAAAGAVTPIADTKTLAGISATTSTEPVSQITQIGSVGSASASSGAKELGSASRVFGVDGQETGKDASSVRCSTAQIFDAKRGGCVPASSGSTNIEIESELGAAIKQAENLSGGFPGGGPTPNLSNPGRATSEGSPRSGGNTSGSNTQTGGQPVVISQSVPVEELLESDEEEAQAQNIPQTLGEAGNPEEEAAKKEGTSNLIVTNTPTSDNASTDSVSADADDSGDNSTKEIEETKGAENTPDKVLQDIPQTLGEADNPKEAEEQKARTSALISTNDPSSDTASTDSVPTNANAGGGSPSQDSQEVIQLRARAQALYAELASINTLNSNDRSQIATLQQMLRESNAALAAAGASTVTPPAINVQVNIPASSSGSGGSGAGASTITQPPVECPSGFKYDSARTACVPEKEVVATSRKKLAVRSIDEEPEATSASTLATGAGSTSTYGSAPGGSTESAAAASARTSGATSSASSSSSGRTRAASSGSQATSNLYGAYIQGETGPEVMLYPAILALANGLLYLRKRKKK